MAIGAPVGSVNTETVPFLIVESTGISIFPPASLAFCSIDFLIYDYLMGSYRRGELRHNAL